MITLIYRALMICLNILHVALLAYCVLSWFARNTAIYDFLRRFVSPLLAPFSKLSRKIMEKTSIPLDFSVIFAFIALAIIQAALTRLYWFIV